MMIHLHKFQNARASSACPQRPARRVVVTRASKGFGKSSKSRVETEAAPASSATPAKQNVRVSKESEKEAAKTSASAESPRGVEPQKGWRDLGDISELFAKKAVKVVDVGSGVAVVVYQHKEKVYCSEAMSTAYQFPLVDAKILENARGEPLIESPLDGTQYRLADGKVEVWCPGTNPLRKLLGTLKKDVKPIDLEMYPVKVLNNRVYGKLVDL
mmetsp:Transcript_14546/g.31674  ORF Transcript_14546/g.31674 Transcript_14546/m.31674 type:complete len:214 (-) Transcript_14546:888-1529(-)|eukprot:CAMPEP_0202912266 /NCGR_PEP_ID=MMETSP1392-20130828/57278_1 /ASSEMBLY_ACC=CAM_ASM_000868 /TAXON_ID=225041 /ORGANISM="Chlamydomonas chlamydogama, Strain SAG 11-48b" /LENGTH=213 /DNA_ID=CAMNT_0049603107 /DNA_START=28 /DNA_END=669 /DNA_ORIENTATION=-